MNNPLGGDADRGPLEIIMDSLGEGLIMTDDDGRISFMNRYAEEMFATSEEEVRGSLFSDFLKIYDKLGVIVRPADFLIPRVLRTGRKAAESTFYYASPHRKKFPAAVTTAPVLVDKRTVGTASIFRNMQKEASIDKAKTEFVSLASHQLRTPLTAIKLFTEILLSKHTDPNDEEKEILENIECSNEKMIQLVNDLLNVANMEAGRLKPEFEVVSIADLVAGVLGETFAVAHKRNINIHYTCKIKDGVKIETDPKLLRQIINNIVTNAIEYSRNDSKVAVRVYKDRDKWCIISVRDRGIGISKRAQKEIFNRFFRAQNAIKFKTESSGLGLYVCRMMIEAIGGRITFKTVEGKGTTFFVCIPQQAPTIKT
ncbi:MAG: hypothetical protein RJB39_560 [Candidatus Parcubacteria bacterium]|jgi:PAS domain S-box-containing protein